MTVPKTVHPAKPKTLPKSLGFSRYALDFDGAEDYIDIPDDPSLEGMAELTVSAWVKPTAAPDTDRGILSKMYDEVYDITLGSGGGFFFQLTNDAGTREYIGAGSWSIGEWTHVAGVYDGATMYFYQDGDLLGTASQSGDVGTNTDPVTVGARPGPDFFCPAVIDDPRVYETALSADEIREIILNYHLPIDLPNLVGWWRLKEGTGTTVEDSSGTGNDGTLNPSNDPPIWRDVKKWELRSEVGL